MTKDREIEALHRLIRRTNADFIHRAAGERIKFLTLNNEQSKRKRKAKAKAHPPEFKVSGQYREVIGSGQGKDGGN